MASVLYRPGTLVRIFAAGQLALWGRLESHHVKIRCFRIDLRDRGEAV